MTRMVPETALKRIDMSYLEEVLRKRVSQGVVDVPPSSKDEEDKPETYRPKIGKYGRGPSIFVEDRTYNIGETSIPADLGFGRCAGCTRTEQAKAKLSKEDRELALTLTLAASSRAESMAMDTGMSHLPLDMGMGEATARHVTRPVNPYDFTVERMHLTGAQGACISAFDLVNEKPLPILNKQKQPVAIVPMLLANGSLRLRNVLAIA